MTVVNRGTTAVPEVSRTAGDAAEQLAAFLAGHGHRPDELVGQIGTSFGELSLVVASGSVVLGYANQKSDLDLYAVGDIPETDRVPIVSHELGPLIDITLIRQTELSRQRDSLRDSPELIGPGDAPANKWRRTGRALDRATRLACGVVLHATPAGSAVVESLRAGWLTDRVVTWWRLEAWRRLLAARWLEKRNPLLAAQRGCDARLCALKAVACRAEQPYFPLKWVGRELCVMRRDDLLAVYHEALRAAWDPATAVTETAEVVDRLAGPAPADLVVEAAYARGVETREVGEATLISRWEMRGARLDAADLPEVPGDGRVIWTGSVGDSAPEWLMTLLDLGFVWIGVAHGGH